METQMIVSTLILGGALLPGILHAQVQQADPLPPFEQFVVPPSGSIRFLLSERGRQLLRRSPHPQARTLLRWIGEDVAETVPTAPAEILLPAPSTEEEVLPQNAGVVTDCGTAYGTRFNLEPRPNPQPQNTQSVDFLHNRVATGVDLVIGGSNDYRGIFNPLGTMSGYYVSRDADCAPEFEGGLPPLTDPFGGDQLFGGGDPVVAADPVRDAVFMADLRLNDTINGIGVFRSSTATLLRPGVCPAGTHTAAQAATCWPTQVLTLIADNVERFFVSQPHLAIDERPRGTGAGNVYIVATEYLPGFSTRIQLVACTNTLVSCSAPVLISGPDTNPGFAHVAVRPNGHISITWTNRLDFPTLQFKYRACTPAGASAPPTCGATSLVHTETQFLYNTTRLGAQAFRLFTHPKHDHRVDANGTETYVVWDRCKVATDNGCPDVDVVMKASKNNGRTWSALTCVLCNANDQLFSALKTDRSRNIVNIAAYSSATDTIFQHRVRLILLQIKPGAATPDPVDAHVLTTLLNAPSGDPKAIPNFLGGFGDYIGVAARGSGADGQSRVYVHFTYNNIQGSYNGVQAPEQNNHLSQFDY